MNAIILHRPAFLFLLDGFRYMNLFYMNLFRSSVRIIPKPMVIEEWMGAHVTLPIIVEHPLAHSRARVLPCLAATAPWSPQPCARSLRRQEATQKQRCLHSRDSFRYSRRRAPIRIVAIVRHQPRSIDNRALNRWPRPHSVRKLDKRPERPGLWQMEPSVCTRDPLKSLREPR